MNLSNVTLFSMIWNHNQDLLDRTIRVLNYCSTQIQFKRVILCSSDHPKTDFSGEVISIPTMNWNSWRVFYIRSLWSLLKMEDGEFLMQVHEDGFPINWDRWEANFLNYDFIGAPWRDGIIGNDGFSIQSSKFMFWRDHIGREGPIEAINPDEFACRGERRKRMESLGIRFPEKEVAIRFSTELTDHETVSFGFHGRSLCGPKYEAGWKKIEQWEKAK